MNLIKMAFSLIMIVLQFCGCREYKGNVQVKIVDSTRKDTIIVRTPEKIDQSPYESVFWEKPVVDCKFHLNADQKDYDEFLNTFIKFYEVRSLPERRLINKDYCKFILKKTPSQSDA